MPPHHPHILNASTSLLGICFVLITSLKLTGSNSLSWGDEMAWVAAGCFLASTLLSYLAVRQDGRHAWQAEWADRVFLAGLLSLFLAVAVMAIFI